MLDHLEDHHGIPLLFGVVTKSEPMCLITKFHGQKDESLTLFHKMRKFEVDIPIWVGIVMHLIEALDHIQSGGILYNVVMKKRKRDWNQVIIDFVNAHFALDPSK